MNMKNLKELLSRKSKTIRTVVRVCTMMLLAFASGRVAETLVIFGSYYLVHSQAGGLEVRNHLLCAAKMVVLWAAGIFLGGYACPDLLMYVLLFLANLTVYLFAPVTGKADADLDVERRRQKKNRAFFASGGFSCLVLALREPASTQILIALLAVMLDIWAVFAVELLRSDNSGTEE